MDPNVALAEIRRIVALSNERPLTRDESDSLAFHVEGLDEWLSSGGFLPGAWSR